MTPTAFDVPTHDRSLWQRFYEAVLELRRNWHLGRARKLPCPVLSVGNLHWGGGGKTPLTAAVASHLRDQGHNVAILSRGYKGKGSGVRVVSTGAGPLLGPTVVGDEPVLLAGELRGVGVVVCADRYLAGVHALERFEPKPDLLLLDDGFSHVRLARDIDILAFPAADPFGGGRLAPGGRLREPLSASRHAEAVVLTGGQPGDGATLAQALAPFGYRGLGFSSSTSARPARTSEGLELEAGAAVIAVSGIARPEPFQELAREQGFDVVATLALADHHDYPDATLLSIRKLWSEHQPAAVLTTSKDRVKLQGRLELPLAEIPVRVEPEDAFFAWLDGRLAEIAHQATK